MFCYFGIKLGITHSIRADLNPDFDLFPLWIMIWSATEILVYYYSNIMWHHLLFDFEFFDLMLQGTLNETTHLHLCSLKISSMLAL